MVLSSIGDGGVHNGGGGVLCQCGVYNRSNPSLFGYSFCGPAYFIKRADKLLRVLLSGDAPLYFNRREDSLLRLRFSSADAPLY